MLLDKEFLDENQIREFFLLKVLEQPRNMDINDILRLIPNTLPKSKINFKIECYYSWWRVGYFTNDIKLIVTDSYELIDGLYGLVYTLKNQNLI